MLTLSLKVSAAIHTPGMFVLVICMLSEKINTAHDLTITRRDERKILMNEIAANDVVGTAVRSSLSVNCLNPHPVRVPSAGVLTSEGRALLR